MAAAKLLNNGCWTWFNSPVASYDSASSAIYIGWVDSNGNVLVGKYSPTYELLQYAQLHDSLGVDDHDNPAVLPLASGKILACYSQHGGDSYSSTTTSAGDIRAWAAEVAVGTVSDSYALLAQTGDTNDTVWWFSRDTNSVRQYRVSTNDGASWATAVGLFAVATLRPYHRICVGSGDANRIDHLFTNEHPKDGPTSSVYHFYQIIDSSGTFYTLYKSDGTTIGAYNLDGTAHTGTPPSLPLGPSNVTQIYDGSTNKAWIVDLCWVGSTLTAGYVVYTTTTNTDDTHAYYRAQLTSGSWASDLICDGGTDIPNGIYPDATPDAEPQYSGLFAFDVHTADRVYVSRKLGANVSGTGDQRIEQWDKSGTWAKTLDITGVSAGGSTGHINARPMRVDNSSTTRILYWSGVYSSWSSFATDVWAYPSLDTFAVKTSSPTWEAAEGPLGTGFYALLNEGTGAPANLVTGSAGTNIGTPTWGSNSYGATLGGFSTSIAVQFDSLASSYSSTAGYPRCLCVMFSNADTSAGQYMFLLGNATDSNPLWGLSLDGSVPSVGMILRGDVSELNLVYSTSKATDGNPHVLSLVSYSSTLTLGFLDGVQVASSSSNPGAYSFQNFTLGCIRRNGLQTNPFHGSLIAALATIGSVPDQHGLYRDLIEGQFGGSRGAITPPAAAPIFFFLDSSISGGFSAMGL